MSLTGSIRRTLGQGSAGDPRTLISKLTRDIRGVETEPKANSKHLRETIHWLFRSQDVTNCGGSAAVYNLVLGWDGPYPETTGYIIPTLYEYGEWADSPEARRRALEMARWLRTTQLADGSFPGSVLPDKDPDPSVFNTGQIVLGLARAYEETGDEAFRRSISFASRWLISVQHQDGCWDVHDYEGVPHSYASRVAWALLVAADITGNDEFRRAAANNLSWVVTKQRDNGWFENCGFTPDQTPFLHTIAYTIRGLLEGGVLLNDREFFAAARTAADWLLNVQRRDGVLRGEYDADWSASDYYCLTGNAQIAIVWLRFAEITGDQQYREAAYRSVEFLKTKHPLDGPEPIRGGVKGSHPVWQRYMYLRYPNWSAKFFADALLGLEREGGIRISTFRQSKSLEEDNK